MENEEELPFTDDIYNITICAILTRNCNPMEVGSCIKQCFFVFMSQALLGIFFYISIDKNSLKFVPVVTN
jgi:hypothetical protein